MQTESRKEGILKSLLRCAIIDKLIYDIGAVGNNLCYHFHASFR